MSQNESSANLGESVAFRAEPIDHGVEKRQYRGMPKELGVLLVVAGIGGILLPGPIGTPILLLGGVILWPKAFKKWTPAWRSVFPGCTESGIARARSLPQRHESSVSPPEMTTDPLP